MVFIPMSNATGSRKGKEGRKKKVRLEETIALTLLPDPLPV